MINAQTRQRGFSLLEMMGAMAVATAMLLGLTYWIDMGVEDSKGQQAALYQKRFADGIGKFIQDPTWNAYIKANATTTVPVKVTMSTLTAGNFMPPGSGAMNAYGQTPCGLIYYSNVSDRIDALITTEGGTPIPEKQLAYVASNAGDGAGFISNTTPTLAKGAYGGWSVTLSAYTDATAAKNCSGTPAGAGRMATMVFREASGTLQSEFLYRHQVPGRPDLNTMNTPLIMSASTVQTSNTACPTNGAIARDTNGAVLSCQSGLWKSQGSAYWQDPVANVAALPTCDAAAAWQTRIVQTPTVGTGPRAYTCNGATWNALSVDDSGNLTAAGSVAVGGAIGAGITTTSTLGAACAAGSIAKTTAGAILYCDTNTFTYRQASAGQMAANTVQITGVVVENAACPNGTADNGRIARDSNGLILSCQSGVWRKLVTQGIVTGGCQWGSAWGTATNCGLGAGITCAAGNTARIVTFHTGGGHAQWNSAGTYAHGFCVSN